MSEIKVTVYRTVQQKAEFMINFTTDVVKDAEAKALELSDGDFKDLEIDDQNIVIGNADR
jgi:hypothetical protein